MHLMDLKRKPPAELVAMAEELGVENASTLRKQDLLFSILKSMAENDTQIMGSGTIEVLPDGFGFLRSPEANYLAGPDDIYVSPSQVRRFGMRTGDTVDGEIRAPKDGERYFALTKLNAINFDDPEQVRHRVNFDNLTPLYPDAKLKLDTLDPTVKDKSARVIDIISPQRLTYYLLNSVPISAVAAGLAVVVGLLSLLARLLRFDLVASFLSRPILAGFMTGIALSIVVGQIGRTTGIAIEADGLVRPVVELVGRLDEIHGPTLALAAAMLALLLIMRRMRTQVRPGGPQLRVGGVGLAWLSSHPGICGRSSVSR